jgi:hypothetical protein
MQHLPFVFIIGFNKTGTVALHNFFAYNGFPSVHWKTDRYLALSIVNNCLNNQKIFYGFDQQFRVFSDLFFCNHNISIEANRYFRIMDRDYPGSYFIYNYRKMENWIASRCNHSNQGADLIERFRSVYNTQDDEIIKGAWRRERENFESEIRAYFGNSPRYMELDIEAPDVASRISRFLDRPLVEAHWQQANKTQR